MITWIKQKTIFCGLLDILIVSSLLSIDPVSVSISHTAKDPISIDLVPTFSVNSINLKDKKVVNGRLIYQSKSSDFAGPDVIDNRIEIWSGGKKVYPSSKRPGITVSAKANPMKLNRTGAVLPVLTFNLIATSYQEPEKFQWGYDCTLLRPLNIYGSWQQVFWTTEATKQNFNNELVHFFIYAMLEIDANVPIKAGDYTGTVDWLTAEVSH
ncbi:MAG: hypothetical protein ABF415_01425 [Leuconostoc pseudomesenteroides]|uniref:hypothetical protein n=1 Tax=Leuconostoc pseudomesenteroides TaxID=33968 RepID=UPI0039ED51F2